MKTRLQFRTFYGLIMSFFLLLSISSYSQTNIAKQSFENSGDNWTYTPNPAADSFTASDDIWGVLSSLNNINTLPTDGNQFYGGSDINNNDNPNGGFGLLVFDDFNVTGYNSITLTFDYEVEGFDNGDDIDYTLILDGVAQSEINLIDGSSNLTTSDSESINIPNGTNTVGIEIKITQNGGDYVAVDNFQLNGTVASGNPSPLIINISQSPVDGNVTSSDPVSVSAEVSDTDGISSVNLNWGTTSGSLSSTINMSVSSGNTYTTTTNIPAQADGTTVYYEIVATDSNTSPATTISLEQNYLVEDPLVLNSQLVQDFDNTTPEWTYSTSIPTFGDQNDFDNDYFGPIDISNASPLDYSEFSNNIFGENDLDNSNGGVAGFAEIIFNEVDISSSSNVVLLFDYDIEGYNAPNDDAKYEVFFDGVPQGEVFIKQGGNTSENAEGTIGLSIPNGTNSVALTIAIRNDGADGFSGFDNFQLIENTTYTYNGSWSPANPVGNATTIDNIEITSGTVEIGQDLDVNNVTINTGATLEISANLTANDITNNGDLIFKSTSIQNTGTLGPINPSATIPNVTVERFIPARRAFRFISSSVTTSSSINENWQENQHNTGINFPSDNENNNDGFGTHITGSTTGANGFDATPSGNPSLFMFDNSTQTWTAVINTDSNSLTAGEPYRLMVRGSRAVDVTDNDATATDTRLRATGSLVTGSQVFSNLTDDVNEFNFVGNPYQAVVNMNSVLASSTAIDDNEYYVWDPNKNTRGGYVTVALPAGTNSDGSAANEFLQPNQAFFVAPTGGSNPELVFEENHKVINNLTSVFSEDQDISLTVQLIGLNNNQATLTDSFMVLFNETYSDTINKKDASKLGNLDENIALVNGSHLLSVERRSTPIEEDSLVFFNNNYRFNNYNLKVEIPQLENIEAILYDDYLKTETNLIEGVNTINFTVDSSIEESIKTDRFSIYFKNQSLSVLTANQPAFSLYPNPYQGGMLTIQTSLNEGEKVNIKMYNLLGEQVFASTETIKNQSKIMLPQLTFPPGIYVVQLQTTTGVSSQKIIIE